MKKGGRRVKIQARNFVSIKLPRYMRYSTFIYSDVPYVSLGLSADFGIAGAKPNHVASERTLHN